MAVWLLLLALQAKPVDDSVLVKVAENARLPHLALDADGNAYVAFVRNGNIELALSTDGGKTFGPPAVVLNSGGKDAGIQNRGPRVSIDRNKRVWVSGPIGTDLFYAVSTDRGRGWSKPFLIAPAGIHAAAAGPGELHVAWIEDQKGLFYGKFDAAGKRVGKAVAITGFCTENSPPGIAVDPAGNPAVAWRESKPPRGIHLSRSTDAGKSFVLTTTLNTLESGLTECPQDAPAVAFSGDGKTFAAAWMDRRDVGGDADIYWTYGPPGKLSPDTDCLDDRRYQQRRPALAIDAEGAVWCAWEDSRLTAQRLFFTNSKLDPNIPLGDGKEGLTGWPSLAASGARVAIAYQSGPNVAFRLLAGK